MQVIKKNNVIKFKYKIFLALFGLKKDYLRQII